MTKHSKVTASSKAAASPKLKPLVSSILAWIHRPVTLTLAFGAMPMVAFAQMPVGGEVIAGSANIAMPDAAHTVIQQGSEKAVINWQSFSIGKDGYVQFVQPGSSAVTLNRVVGIDPSQILGRLSANGQIFLVNPNGVFFSQSAVVDVGGIVATTLDINNDDFMRGDYRFSRSAQAATGAGVVNEGSITAQNGGYVVLAGDYAANKGIVQAQLGTAVLASGDALTLQTSGSGLVSFQVDKATVARLAGVENSGQILANGGRVIMTADVANDLAATVVNNTGLVQAQSLVEKDGAVYFAGQGGNVVNSGTVDASAQAGANGGYVDIRATGDITHEAGSLINVSGANTGTSNAGSVYTWADGTNHYKKDASIVARGGAQGGNGGQVELSGNKVLNRSTVDLRAPNGKLGTLTLDPTAITIASGNGTDAGDQSTIYEANLETQLKTGNIVLAATGPNASITLEDLADGILDGSNFGTGGSLTLTASGSGAPTITFANATNTIKVDGALSLAVDNGSGNNAVGSIAVGHLQAGTAINLKAGSVSAGNLSVAKTINSGTNSSYNIDAHAYNGSLTLGNVTVDVTNTQAAGVNSSVALRAEGGNVTTGDVTAKATGLGYYNYNWSTAGNAAPTYLGQQPWTLNSQGDHAISASLAIQATGDVSTGTIDVAATDSNTAFSSTPGGYWQTATATQHNFWRPTAASASATITAAGNVSIAGKTSVVADGYAMNSYSETETWRTMVDNFNYTSGTQVVTTQSTDGNGNPTTVNTPYNYNNLKGSMKGAGSQRYIWEFGPYTTINGANVNNNSNVTVTTDRNPGSGTPNSYGGLSGLSSTLDISAAGSVSMDGMDVRSLNHSVSGNASFSDVNWGHQDTANGLNGTASNFTSANQEVDYDDTFATSYTAAASTSRATITAGTSVSMAGGANYDVIAGYPQSSVPGFASMSVTAQNGALSIGSDVNVIGSSTSDVTLTLRADNGDIDAANMHALVKNGYFNADARATVTNNTGAIHLGGLSVTGERSAYVEVTSAGDLSIDGATSATSNAASSNGVALAYVNLTGNGNVALGDVLASSEYFVNNRVSGYYDAGQGFGYDYQVYGGTAGINVQSSTGNLTLNGDVEARGYETASVSASANAPGKTLTTAAGKTVSSTAIGQTFTSSPGARYLRVPTYSALTSLWANNGMSLGSSVGATVVNRNGVAVVGLTTYGGSSAAISQGASSLIKASGSSASVSVNAGDAGPTASTAAALDMLGAIVAESSTGTASVNVNGASGTVSGLGATSGSSAATVSVNALDSSGALVLGGNGTISTSLNSGNAAQLLVNAAGSLDASAASISVTNNSTGNVAGARANLVANNGSNQVGSISVNGYNTAILNATGTGDVSAAGAASASTNAAAGHAEANLASSTAGVGIADGGSLAVTASGSLATADAKLTGITGATLNGNASATANSGTAKVLVTTTGGSNAAITQGVNSTLLARGATAELTLNAGDAAPTVSTAATFNLLGNLQARSVGGSAALAVNGKAGAVHDFSAEGAEATADITALDGALDLTGEGSVSGNTVATLNATSTGNLSTRDLLSAALTSPSNTAQVNLSTSTGALLVDSGSHVKANSVLGKADINLTAVTGMTLNGNVSAQSSNNDATVDLLTTGGSTAGISQGANSTLLADGSHGALTLTAGNATPTAGNAAAVALAGNLQARGSAGTADIVVKAASGSVHDFSAQSTGNKATVDIASLASTGAVALNGIGNVSANSDTAAGALLKVTSAGALNTNAAALAVTNLSNGSSAGAKVNLQANGGNATLGQIAVTAQGGGDASLLAKAAANLTATSNLSASNLGLGAAGGKALVGLSTTGSPVAVSTISQVAGTTLSATSSGNAGDATVDVQASNCCTSAALLNGNVAATVNNGAGNASVGVRGNTVAVYNVQSAAKGTGNALLNIGAPSEIQLNGPIQVTAADTSKRADIKLISDRLTDRAPTIVLSTGNGHVQLASFNTNNIIGVNSARDFDSSVQTNYTLTTLNKLRYQLADVTFGGAYDRSAWTQGTPQTAWVPGMAAWANQGQQVGDIHVAGDSNIDLRDVKMVFDTTGTTYYHDMKMSTWSVPTGRVATYVQRPVTNYDRYLDRTDFSLQNLNHIADDSFTSGNTLAVNTAASGGSKQISGNLFMNGDGVNMVRNAVKADAVSVPQGKEGQGEQNSERCTGLNANVPSCGF